MFGIETQDLIIYAFLVLAIPAGLIGFLVAGSKHREAFAWCFACMIFPPAILVVLLLNHIDRIDDLEDEVRRLKEEADAGDPRD